MASIIGIDLGTSYSGVAQFDEFGRLKMVSNEEEGNYLVPSCVAFIKGKWLVGGDAYRVWGGDQNMEKKSSAARFKREMGTSKLYQIGPHSVSPVELSSRVLKHIASYAQKAVGPTAPVVITVPANFGDPARKATMDAAKEAGLEVLNIINEPTAAALYYAFEGKISKAGTYAIFDLGGGTFDITIANFDGKEVNVEWSEGIARLGGIDFDKALQTIVKEKYEEQTGKKLSPENMAYEGFDLLRIQELKHSLSRHEESNFNVPGHLIEVTRKEFESSIGNLLMEIRKCCEKILAKAGLATDDLDGVILAGGSTRIPMIRECIRKVFGKEPMDIANVDEVVALGAALYAAIKIKGTDITKLTYQQSMVLKPFAVQEITTKYFGTNALRHDEKTGKEEEFNSIIIKKGTDIPCKKRESYYTVFYDQRKVKCCVTECDEEEENINSDLVKTIGNADLALPPGRPAGQEILVTYKYDENQIMHCYFKDVETEEEIKIEIDFTKGT